MKPIKLNIKNPFAPIPMRPKTIKPARTAQGISVAEKTNLRDTSKQEMVVFHPINTKGYYDGPERIDPQQLEYDEEAEDEEC